MPLLAIASDAVRADIEELLELAEHGERASREAKAPRDAVHQAVEEVARRPADATTVPDGAVMEPIAVPLREVLVGVLASSPGPMRVRDIANAALARGWTTSSASPRNVGAACLDARPEFVSVGGGEGDALGIGRVRRDAPSTDEPTPATPVGPVGPSGAFVEEPSNA